MRAKRLWTWVFSLILLALLIWLSYAAAAAQPKPYPPYVSESPSPTGTKAWFAYLQKQGVKVQAWRFSPATRVGSQDKSLLVQIEPDVSLQESELAAYRRFMQEGGTLMLWSEQASGMYGLDTEALDTWPDQPVTVTNERDDKKMGGAALQADVRTSNRWLAQSGDEVLLRDQEGIIALQRQVGKGRLIAAVTPSWLQNERILEQNHLELVRHLFNVAGSAQGGIWIDEYIHGYEQNETPLSVYPQWFLVLLLQASLLLIGWLWYKGKRFGPVFTLREESVRYSDEHLGALAAWYLRGRKYHEALAIHAKYVRQRLQDSWGVPLGVSWKELPQRISQKWPGTMPEEMQKLCAQLEHVLAKPRLSKPEYLLWASRLDRLQKEVEKHEKPDRRAVGAL